MKVRDVFGAKNASGDRYHVDIICVMFDQCAYSPITNMNVLKTHRRQSRKPNRPRLSLAICMLDARHFSECLHLLQRSGDMLSVSLICRNKKYGCCN
jgi:hypothetical protein